MAYIVVHCGACGGRWEVYRRQRDTSAARTCPHCDYVINVDTWKKKVLPAYEAVGSANEALGIDHVEKHCAPFSVDVIADTDFANAEFSEVKNLIRETATNKTYVVAVSPLEGGNE